MAHLDGSTPDSAQGVHGHGSRTFDAVELARVRQLVTVISAAKAHTVETIADLLGMDGRTVRAALSWLDGREVLLSGHNNGYQVCEYADDGEQLTATLCSQVASMQDRLERRRAFAQRLPRRPPPLPPEPQQPPLL